MARDFHNIETYCLIGHSRAQIWTSELKINFSKLDELKNILVYICFKLSNVVTKVEVPKS